jgi:NADH-quinone oxidoreductase subunit J
MINTKWKVFESEIPYTTAYNVGTILLQDYVIVFELLGILLLIALIGAASMARRSS